MKCDLCHRQLTYVGKPIVVEGLEYQHVETSGTRTAIICEGCIAKLKEVLG